MVLLKRDSLLGLQRVVEGVVAMVALKEDPGIIHLGMVATLIERGTEAVVEAGVQAGRRAGRDTEVVAGMAAAEAMVMVASAVVAQAVMVAVVATIVLPREGGPTLGLAVVIGTGLHQRHYQEVEEEDGKAMVVEAEVGNKLALLPFCACWGCISQAIMSPRYGRDAFSYRT